MLFKDNSIVMDVIVVWEYDTNLFLPVNGVPFNCIIELLLFDLFWQLDQMLELLLAVYSDNMRQ